MLDPLMVPAFVLAIVGFISPGDLMIEWEEQGEYRRIEVIFPVPLPEDADAPILLLIENIEVVGVTPEGISETITPELVRAAAPAFGKSGEVMIENGLKMYRKASIKLPRNPHGGRKYRVRLLNGLAEFFEAKGEPVESQAIDGPTPEKSWLNLGDDLPRLTLQPRVSDESSALSVDFHLAWLEHEFKRFGEGLDMRELRFVVDTEGYYDTGLEDGELDESLNTISTDLRFEYERTENDESGEKQTSVYTFDIHVSHESLQTLEVTTVNVGAGVYFRPGFLFDGDFYRYNFLDASARTDFSAPRFYLSYDAVFNADRTNREDRTGEDDDSFSRLEGAAAWGFPVLRDESYFEAVWRGFYDLDADANEYESLTEVTLFLDLEAYGMPGTSDLPLVMVKYIDGGLPPNYGSEHSLSVGFSIQL